MSAFTDRAALRHLRHRRPVRHLRLRAGRAGLRWALAALAITAGLSLAADLPGVGPAGDRGADPGDPGVIATSTRAIGASASGASTAATTADTPALPSPGTPATIVDRRTAPPLLPGWPQVMGTTVPYSPAGLLLADLDRNGVFEVIAGSTDNRMRVWDVAGNLWPGWPASLGGQIQSKPAAADLDGDGDLEILVNVKTGRVHALQSDGSPVAGWPQTSNLTFGFLSPSIYDLDGDGTPEVLIGGSTSVKAWRADGTPWPGFPVSVGSTITGTLAIADVTGNGQPEIFVVTSGTLYAFDTSGAAVPGWPQTFGLSTSYAAPSIGDIDHDGDREILVVGYNISSGFTRIHAYHADGTAVIGFPVTYSSLQTYSCPVIGDVDGDDDLELFNAGKVNGDCFYAWDHTGTLLPGWPTPAQPNMEGSCILADFDGDADLEAVIGDNYIPGFFWGYEASGSTVVDFPFPKLGSSGPNAPEVADVDGDGDLDMGMTMNDGSVALWDFAVAYDPGRVEWGGLFHDNWNTNQHGFVVPLGPVIGVEPAVVTDLDSAPGAARPNPFASLTTLPFGVARSGRVRAIVHDVQGRELRTLVDRELAAGEHQLSWDGRDAQGESTPPGVYFVRLRSPDRTRTVRVVRAR